MAVHIYILVSRNVSGTGYVNVSVYQDFSLASNAWTSAKSSNSYQLHELLHFIWDTLKDTTEILCIATNRREVLN